ncbi:MAG: aldo/keto reductase [Brucellaceae bacterium]|nr:aldo/keto reductase [Brucellaceae bacterium]
MAFARRSVGGTGLTVPTLGFGGAPLGGLFDAVSKAQAEATLREAFKAGMTYVDTAPFYGFGNSERRVGDLLRGQNYVLSTKVGRLLQPGLPDNPAAMGWPDPLPFHPVFDYSHDGIRRSFEDSLQRLGLDRIDILYVHDIGTVTHGDDNAGHWRDLERGGYRALDELRSEGRVRAIGLGVNESAVCLDALGIGDWDVFLLAGRYTLLEQAPLEDLLPACEAAGTSLVIGGPFNSGVLVGGDTWDYGTVPVEVRTRVAALSACCNEYGVPLPAAALQFPLAHPAVASVIPGLRSPAELADTLSWTGHAIPPAFWAALKDGGLVHQDAPLPDGNPFEE